MTVQSQTSKTQYNGDGSTTGFSTVFAFTNDADVTVILTDVNNIDTTQVLSSNYTLTGAGTGSAGTVTMITAPASGERLTIFRDPPLTQNTDYIESDPFPAESHEAALDKLTHIAQRTREITEQSVRLPDSSTVDPILPSPEADKVIGWNSSATGLENKDANNDSNNLVTPTGASIALSHATHTARYINVDDFGAKNTGIVSDASANNTAIAAALTACLSQGYKELRFTQGGRYVLDSSIVWSEYQGIDMIMDGAEILPKDATGSYQLITYQGSSPTSWVNLSSDADNDDISITTSSAITGAVKGAWLTIKSNATLPNGSDTYEVTRRIVAVSGSTYTFEVPLEYNFTTADSAQAGLATVLDKPTRFIGVKSGGEDYDDTTGDYNYARIFGIGMNLKNVANVIVDTPFLQGNKVRTDNSSSYSGRSAIKLENAMNCTVKYPYTKDIGWYGVQVLGGGHDVDVVNSYGNNCRHAVDITDAVNGEPRRTRFINPTAVNCSIAGISTHPAGQETSILNPHAVSNGWASSAAGILIRSPNVFIQGGVTKFNTSDGLQIQDDADNCTVEGVRSQENGRDGFNSTGVFTTYISCRAINNSSGEGFYTGSGQIKGGRSTGNLRAVRMNYNSGDGRGQLIDGLYAPFSSGQQTVGILIPTSYNAKMLKLRNSEMVGYGDFLYQIPSGLQADYYIDTDGSNTIHESTSGGELTGTVTLSSGTATVATTSIRNQIGPTTRGPLISKIDLRVVTASSAGQLRVSVNDETSFTITSSNASDASVIYWRIGF